METCKPFSVQVDEMVALVGRGHKRACGVTWERPGGAAVDEDLVLLG